MWIVTGMHRSGTSLLARIFFEAKADMGDPATFQEGDRWNPDGYFEQKEVIGLNMRLIHGPFWKFSYLRLPSAETIVRRGGKKAEVIRSLSEKYSSSVVKDTRFCLTLPAWRAYGARIDGVLVCLRDPLAVAGSLRKRNRISIRRGLSLWLVHMQRLMAATSGMRVHLVLYRSLLDPNLGHSETARALEFAGLSLSEERISDIRSACVKPEMDHNPAEASSSGAERHIWEDLLRRHSFQSRHSSQD